MWNLLKPLFDSIFSSIIGAITQRFEREEREAAQWAAESRKAMLESIKEGRAAEKALKATVEEAKAKAPTSAHDWNILLLFLPLLLLTGCFRFQVYSQPYQAVPPDIERPILPLDIDGDGLEDSFNVRESALAAYATQLESVLNAIKEKAIESNHRNGYSSP